MPGHVERFWAKVDKTDECWLWTGCLTGKGYGMVRYDGRGQPAHRVSYRLEVGPIADGLHIDHLCRVPACVRPDHLEAVTPAVNQARGLLNQNAPKMVCGTCGGPFDRTALGTNGNVWRFCSACANRRKRETRAARKAAGDPRYLAENQAARERQEARRGRPRTVRQDRTEKARGAAENVSRERAERARALRAQGQTNAAIAHALDVHERTVARYLAKDAA